jgi:hypothetical protein
VHHQVHSALVTALDYDSETGWLISAADDGMVVVYKETEEVRHDSHHRASLVPLHTTSVRPMVGMRCVR